MPGSLSNKLSRATDSDTGRPVISTLASPGKAIGAASVTISDATNWTTTSKIYFAIYNLTSAGYKDPTSQTDWVGTLSGTTVSNLTLTGGTDRAYLPGATIEQTVTGKQLKDTYDLITAQHNGDTGAHGAITTTSIANAGSYNQASGTFSVPDKSIPISAFNNPYRFSVYLNGTQGCPSTGSFFKILIDTKEYDPSNNFDTTNKRFTATVAGIYNFKGAIGIGTPSAGEHYIATLYKNGTEFKRGLEADASVNNVNVSRVVLADISLAVGDYVELWGYGQNNRGIINNSVSTYFSGYLVSAT